MKRVKGYLLTLMVLVTCAMWHSSNARINAGGGFWCDSYYTWDDYTRTLQQVLYNCTWAPQFPYFPEPPPDPPFGGGGGGGGGGNTPTFPDMAISQKLDCALQQYTHGLTQKAGKSFKKVNAWAFGIDNGNGWGYDVRSSPTPPGPEWQSVGGIANYMSTPPLARLYNAAFQGRQHFERTGKPPPSTSLPPNSLNGPISDFEMSLFAGAHELAHLSGVGNNGGAEEESKADWFGIFAVLAHRADGGSKCAGLPD